VLRAARRMGTMPRGRHPNQRMFNRLVSCSVSRVGGGQSGAPRHCGLLRALSLVAGCWRAFSTPASIATLTRLQSDVEQSGELRRMRVVQGVDAIDGNTQGAIRSAGKGSSLKRT